MGTRQHTTVTTGSSWRRLPDSSFHCPACLQHGKFGGSRQAFLSNLQSLRPEVRGSPAVQVRAEGWAPGAGSCAWLLAA